MFWSKLKHYGYGSSNPEGSIRNRRTGEDLDNIQYCIKNVWDVK